MKSWSSFVSFSLLLSDMGKWLPPSDKPIMEGGVAFAFCEWIKKPSRTSKVPLNPERNQFPRFYWSNNILKSKILSLIHHEF